jgi:hypothetical protein
MLLTMKKTLALLLLTFCASAGCDSSTDPEPTVTQFVPPVGSTFYFSGWSLDNKSITEPTVVTATGQTANGKQSVSIFTTGSSNELIAYEPNGDISFMFVDDSSWITFPMVKKGTSFQELKGGGEIRRPVKITHVSDGPETINGKTYDVSRFETVIVQVKGTDTTSISRIDWHWAKDLGFWTERTWILRGWLDSVVIK